MYWDTVLKEVLNKKDASYPCIFTNLKKSPISEQEDGSEQNKKDKQEEVRVFLGQNYPNVYFTKRECQCMLLLLKGKTMKEAGVMLNLSARTVEYYVKNMKFKLECRTKSELIGAVLDSDFIKEAKEVE